jgi:hypothetical protein
MALLAQIETDSGAPSAYQRITEVSYSAGDTNWYLTVEYYLSKEAREAGKKPLVVRRIALPDYRLQPSPMTSFYAALAAFEHTELSQSVGDEQHEVPLFVVNDNDPGNIQPEIEDEEPVSAPDGAAGSAQLPPCDFVHDAGGDLGASASGDPESDHAAGGI